MTGFFAVSMLSQEKTDADSVAFSEGNHLLKSTHKNYILPSVEVLGLNTGVYLFDRFVLKAQYAQVDCQSIKFNLRNGFVWDNDHFSTNLFWHPYHGSLYFNAARSNGLNFWQSIPYAIGGSLTWEYFGENKQPSINDLIATPIGGIAVGEMGYRVANIFIDQSATGLERIGRELIAGLTSPMTFVNRLISGDLWRYKPASDESMRRPPFLLNISVANRFLTDLNNNRSNFNMMLTTQIVYGEHFINDLRSPYDFFAGNIDLNIVGNQPLVSSASILGLIWGQEWHKKGSDFLTGVFQHFDYYDSKPLKNGAKQLFEFAETASFGGGLLYAKKQKNSDNYCLAGGAFANLVILGASESDWYNVKDRNYNLGTGYSIKINGTYFFSKQWYSGISMKYYHFFTGNRQAVKTEESVDMTSLNLKGNEGNARLAMISTDINFIATKHFKISANQQFYLRNTHYKYFPDVKTISTENKLILTYMLFDIGKENLNK
ncbi:MAG: DUF3943 domain-containing protein [Prevotellaceae bacterium]|nr:DUF3943 domain-containing protein [Prevotellaceae bacterium]